MRVMTFVLLLILFVASVPSTSARQTTTPENAEAKRVREATVVFSEIMAAEDNAIPRSILGDADGIAIFPSTIKGGFIVGGLRGRGVLSARSDTGWSSPAFLTLTGGSIGLQ